MDVESNVTARCEGLFPPSQRQKREKPWKRGWVLHLKDQK